MPLEESDALRRAANRVSGAVCHLKLSNAGISAAFGPASYAPIGCTYLVSTNPQALQLHAW
jgi:hypothetical protein